MTTVALEGNEKYRQFIESLNDANVDKYINLPMIAVMGDTSSGKSSLLSNISLVELPSNENLTTRCPIMLRMQHARARSACVKIQWKDKPARTNVDFKEVRIEEENWSDITNAIADAQAHIIRKSGKDVAQDIVNVDVRGPHCENLTLIDLPGIVRTTGKEESKFIADDIQGLMNGYLSNPRCVILAVLPSNVDFHNSQILSEAKEVDPDTNRTIPVLTKPDLIDGGAETSVKELLLGKKTDSFSMGFHMVKGKHSILFVDTLLSVFSLMYHNIQGRGQKALGEKQSIEDGLESEETFFNNKDPWRNVEEKNLFGTKNLRLKLAELQMNLIRSSFKGIVEEMKTKLEEAEIEGRGAEDENPEAASRGRARGEEAKGPSESCLY